MVKSFFPKKQTKPSLTTYKIIWLINKYTDFTATKVEKINRGYANEVYSVSTKEGKKLIIRINIHGGVDFKCETRAIEKCKDINIPVPEVYYFGKVEIDNSFRNIMIESEVHGYILNDLLDSITITQKNEILVKIGEILANIHSIKVNGFGYLRSNLKGFYFNSWREVIEYLIFSLISNKSSLEYSGFSSAHLNIALNYFYIRMTKFDFHNPVLCHGDFLPGNIIVDRNLEIAGIIDFGDFLGAHPIRDISRISYYFPDLDINYLLKGYYKLSPTLKNFDFLMEMSKLEHQMRLLLYYLDTSMPHMIDDKLKEGILRSLKNLNKFIQPQTRLLFEVSKRGKVKSL